MMHSRRLLFIHIPKTAGTSFRHGLSQALGEGSGCYDYGPDDTNTSDIVKAHYYSAKDLWQFQKAFESSAYKFLSGHFPAQRYIHMIGAPNTIAFVREPEQRILSAYRRHTKNKGYQGSILDFIHEERFQNQQHRMLKHSPLSSYGFLGLTESYPQSVRYLNAQFGLEIPIIERNTERSRLSEMHQVGEELHEEIKTLNQLDIALYQQADRLLQTRLELALNNLPFTRGCVDSINNRMVRGWAVRDLSDSPVRISVLVNDEEITQVTATDNRPLLKALGLGRGGRIGFEARLPGLKAGDTVRCHAADTEQEFFDSPFEVSEQHL